MEPPVSEPKPMNAAPVATEMAAPELEPPGIRGAWGSPTAWSVSASQAAGVPWCGLLPTPENANSTILVRPMKPAPAARKRAMAVASCRAGGWFCSTTEPAAVTCPSMSNKSLTDTAKPARDFLATAGSEAVSLRLSGVIWMNACWHAGLCATSTQACATAKGLFLPSIRFCRVAIKSAFMGGASVKLSQDAIILRLCGGQVLSFECLIQNAFFTSTEHIRKPVPSRCCTCHHGKCNEWTGFKT